MLRIATALAVAGVSACTSTSSQPGIPTPGSGTSIPVRFPVIGTVPTPRFGGPEAIITSCRSAGTALIVAGEVTNTATVTRTLLSLRFDVFDPAGRNVDPDGYFGIGGVGSEIGPGMTSRVAGTITRRSALPAEVSCRVRPNVFLPGPTGLDRQLPADRVTLSGCAADSTLTIINPAVREVGVEVIVERFDTAGFSYGQETYQRGPAERTDGGVDPGVAAGAAAVIGLRDVTDQRAIAGCAVVAATYTEHPVPAKIIVDPGPVPTR
ncbi:MAG: hypothetical protein ACR2P2_13120 [Nakamurella sp.]